MKKMSIRIIAVSLILVIVCAVAVHFNAVSLFTSNGFYYSVDTSTTASVYGRYVEDANVAIEREFSDHYITAIVGRAFEEDSALQSLDLTKADMLERIGNYAFYNCVNLSGSVDFAGRINTLGISSFQGCSSLSSARFIGGYVTLIPEQCFYQCSSLSEVILPAQLQRIDRYAFANCPSLSEVTIPASVTYIDPTAFDGNDALTIYCYTDSAAHVFAQENGYNYVLLDYVEPTEPVTEPATEPETEPATDAPTEPATEPESYILGDADGDGETDIVDATVIQRILSSIEVPFFNKVAADIDGSGEIESVDAAYIMRYSAYIITPYAIGELVDPA